MRAFLVLLATLILLIALKTNAEITNRNISDTADHSSFQQLQNETYSYPPHSRGKMGQIVVIIVSMICCLLMLSAYLLVKKLHNFIGKCIMCYVACLFMGYLFLILNLWDLSRDFCLTSGFLGYFFVVASFLWLSVISWNVLSLNPNSTLAHCCMTQHRFMSYSIYAWATAVTFTGFTFLANKIVLNEDWNPRVGGGGQCWINTRDWSAMIYYYGPMLLMVIFNITMFVRSLIDIIKAHRNLERCNKPYRKITFILLLRLFFIMGLSYTFDIISYLVKGNSFWANIFLDSFNWSQGIIIFVLFVLKKSTLKLIKESITNKTADNMIPLEDMNLDQGFPSLVILIYFLALSNTNDSNFGKRCLESVNQLLNVFCWA